MRSYALIFLLISIKSSAQENSGARFMGMANAGTAMEDVFSLGSNQAGISSIKSVTIAFMLEGYNYPSKSRSYPSNTEAYSSNTQSLAAMAVVPTKVGNLGLYTSRYNFENNFNEIVIGLTYARFFSSKLAMAVVMNYHQLAIPEYIADRSLSFDVGFQYHLADGWVWGVHLVNPVGFMNKDDSFYRIPVKLRLGMSYVLSTQVLLATETEYDREQHVNFRLGLEYSVLSWMKLRGGTSINSFKRFAGLGFHFRKINIDVASSFHPQLGISPQFSLSYVF